MLSFPVPVLGFLFVSFRPSLFRSHSRSTGASLLVFSSGINAWLPFPFGLFRFSISLLSLLCFPFLISPIRLTDRFLGSSASPLGSSAFFRFLCLVSRAFSSVLQYLASCLFPFVLPGFAPTAVPPVLTFFRLATSLRCFPCACLHFFRFAFRF